MQLLATLLGGKDRDALCGIIDAEMPRAVISSRGVSQPEWRPTMRSLPDGRVCTRCSEWKPAEVFSIKRASPDGLASWCRPCNIAYQRDRYKQRKPEYQAASRQRYIANPDAFKLKAKAWYSANRERAIARQGQWSAAHPEVTRAIKSKWKRANPDAAVASFHRRKARLVANGGSYTVAEWQSLCAAYGDRCLRCGVDDQNLTVDHVIPLFLGGRNDIANLQPLCLPCNSAKGTQIIDYRVDGMRAI